MNLLQSLIVALARIGISTLCKIDAPDLDRVPRIGPLILAVNHINTLDVPMVEAQLYPRNLIVLAKEETWDNPFMGWLFTTFNAIPIRRGEVDLAAIHRSLEVLEKKEILAIAPEGTRSYDGKLQVGQQGIVLLALRSGVPILPVVHWGGESLSRNFKRFERTPVHIRVGKPFSLDAKGDKVVGKVRQEMVDEIMRQMAALMPAEYRGVYADCDDRQEKYIQFVSE